MFLHNTKQSWRSKERFKLNSEQIFFYINEGPPEHLEGKLGQSRDGRAAGRKQHDNGLLGGFPSSVKLFDDRPISDTHPPATPLTPSHSHHQIVRNSINTVRALDEGINVVIPATVSPNGETALMLHKTETTETPRPAY